MSVEADDADVEVVISGISGKFPESDDFDELKKNLMAKRDLVTEDEGCWNQDDWPKFPNAFGKISCIKKFDATFFGVHSEIVSAMDPLTRTLMERSYEAVVDAGVNVKSLRGTNTAVYTASCVSDSESVGSDQKFIRSYYWLLANARSLMANRVSSILHLNGPSWTIDSTWIGGIECIRHAVDDIKKGRIDGALVGTSNVILFPEIVQHWLDLGKLSPDGKCRSFDVNANGYGRSESTVVLLLQKASDAKRSYGTVVHVDATYSSAGPDSNFLRPSRESMESFLNSFYTTCNVSPSEVAFLEIDGAADQYTHETEIEAIENVFCTGRNERESILVGSVKSNLGHAEASSCLVSLAKGLICLDSGVIPPNIHLSKLNPKFEKLRTGQMKVVTEPTILPEGYVAINTIGLGNCFGHVLLKQNLKTRKSIVDAFGQKEEQIPRLVLISARNENGIMNILDKLETMEFDEDYFSMVNDIFKEHITGHFYRGYTILGATERRIHFTLEVTEVIKKPVWFVFAGMGSQWPGMGADLMGLPVFAKAIDEIDEYLQPLGLNIREIITSFNPATLKNVVHCFVAITAIQIGMVDVLRCIGIKPDGMLGHSLGENSCAYADGGFTKYQTIMAAYYRGKASEMVPLKKKGLMVAVGLGHRQITNLPDNVYIACHNSEDSVTISGFYDDVQVYMEQLKQQNIFVKPVDSNFVAYHCEHVQPMAPYLYENLKKIIPNPKKRSGRWISTSVLEPKWNESLAQYCSAEYFVNNFMHTVYFSEGFKYIPENAIVIEIAPHALFQSILKRSLHETVFNIPLGTRQTSNALNFFLSAIGKLYVAGDQPNVNALYPNVSYPVCRGTPTLTAMATWNHDKDWEIKKYEDLMKIKPLKLSLQDRKWRYLAHNKLHNRIFAPLSLLLMETLQAFDNVNNDTPVLVFENICIKNWAEISASDVMNINTLVQYGSGNFEISSDLQTLICGQVFYSSRVDGFSNYQIDCWFDDDGTLFIDDEIYQIFQEHGFTFSHEFRSITNIRLFGQGCIAKVFWRGNIELLIDSLIQVKLFVDVCNQICESLLPSKFLKLAIDPQNLHLLQYGSELTIIVDNLTGIMQSDGIELIALNTRSIIDSADTSDLRIQQLRFIPYSNTRSLDDEGFLLFCCQLISDNYLLTTANRIIRIYVIGNNNNNTNKSPNIQNDNYLLELMRDQLSSRLKIEILHIRQDELSTIKCSDLTPLLMIFYDVDINYDQLIRVTDCVEQLFVMSWSESYKFHDSFPMVTQKTLSNGITASLFKKTDVHLKEARVFSINQSSRNDDDDWLFDLQEDLLCLKLSQPVFIYLHCPFATDVMNMISRIVALKFHHKLLRFVITMDNFPKFDLENPIYIEQLQKGLTVNILRNFEWGTIGYLPVHQNTTPYSTAASKLDLMCFNNFPLIENVLVKYFKTLCSSSDANKLSNQVKYVEYSGFSKITGKYVAGVVVQQSNERSKILEQIIECSFSDYSSSTDDDCLIFSVMSYIQVYYGLFIKAKLSVKSRILIYDGCRSLGEAAISVALILQCQVFVCAESLEEMNYLKKRFSNNNLLHIILDTNECNADVEILKCTKGCGVQVVVNPFTPERILESIRCISTYGSILIFSDTNECNLQIFEDINIGMEVFLKSTSIISITSSDVLDSVSDLLPKCEELIQKGINSELIKLSRTNNTKQLNYENHPESAMSSVIDQQYLIRNDSCYLVIGNPCKSWYNLICWLLQRDVKKLILADGDDNNMNDEDDENLYSKKLNIILNEYSDIRIMYTSPDHLSEMFSNIGNFSSLQCLFCIGLNAKMIENVDLASREFAPNLRNFVCLDCNGAAAKVCELRQRSCLPSLQIPIFHSLKSLTAILNYKFSTTVDIENDGDYYFPLIKIADIPVSYKRAEGDEIMEYMAKMIQSKSLFSKYENRRPFFDKVVSQCSDYDKRNQYYPIFLIPAVHWTTLQPLIRKLIYPVYSANFKMTAGSSYQDIASSLIQSLKEIQPNGPYTILAELWSGSLAIELVSLLEQEDERNKCRLILLHGIPFDVETIMRHYAKLPEQDFLNYLKNHGAIFENNESAIILAKEFYQRLIGLCRGLTTLIAVNLRCSVIALKYYNSATKDDENNSIFSTHVDFERLYKQELKLHVVRLDSYERLLNDRTTTTVINDNVMFAW